MTKEKWQLNRAGLFNFWYYDDEVFHFEDGKLLLRGTNGSGKSVTMQSLLPVLLDGKKSPDRLDPFGSRSRHMIDYLLGEKEVSNRDERTGYLFIEYKMENTEQYITTGIGMQAKRNQPLKSWGFVITDNRRIGYDLDLYKRVNQHGERQQFPLSQTELTTIVDTGGEVVSSNQEYMRLVNRYIFGFETVEAYDDLIKLLIQLRSPKLSKDFKPTVIYEILEQALPPLTEEDLLYLSDSIEQMDQTKQQMEQLEREVQALTKLNNAYTAYVEQIFGDQLKEWKQCQVRQQKEERQFIQLESELKKLEQEITAAELRKQELMISQETLAEQMKRLEKHEVFDLEQELQLKKQEIEVLMERLHSQKGRLDDKSSKERKTRANINELEERLYMQQQELQQSRDSMLEEAEYSAFDKHELNDQDFVYHEGKAFGFEQWKKEIEAHMIRLESILEQLRKRDSDIAQLQERNAELSKVKHRHDAILLEERKWLQMLQDEKQALIGQVYRWTDQHHYYDITDLTKQKMARYVDDLFDQYEWEQVKALFEHYVENMETGLRQQIATSEARIGQLQLQQEQWQAERQQLQKMREPEPDRHEATIATRKKLDQLNIAYRPLYELVEFRTEVPSDIQVRLESALAETGLLDSLVTAEDIGVEHDRVLHAEPKLFTNTLFDYLQPDALQQYMAKDRIEAVLQSIEMSGEATIHYTADGHYRIGNLYGHALPLEEVRFIGREARKRYRDQLIQQMTEKIDQGMNEIQLIRTEQQLVEQQLQQSKQAWQSFPVSNDVRTSYNEYNKTKRYAEQEEERLKEITIQVANLDEQLQLTKRKLATLTNGLGLELQETVCKEALVAARQYERSLNQLHRDYEQWLFTSATIQSEVRSVAELEAEVDDLRGEVNSIENNKLKLEKQVQHIEEQQLLQGAEEIRQQIQSVTYEWHTVTEELERLKVGIPSLAMEQKQGMEKQQLKVTEVAWWRSLANAWQQTVEKEWKRGIVSREYDDIEAAYRQKYQMKTMKDRSVIEGQLTGLFYSLHADLTEHRMSQYTDIPTRMEWMATIEQEEWKPLLEQWHMKSSRHIIEFDQRGVKIAPAILHETISQELAIQETRIDEMDKQLYEEILLNSVGQKLRAKIRRAEQWTEKMKKLMESRDTSSGLKFSIRWKPKTADSEQELDTQQLVSLLKQDIKLLGDEDMLRITRHFRSKIQSAKLWMEEKGEGETLLQVLKGVLDYRQWFSFVLYYERTGELKRELTNHHFFKFSGGEKAMAMYIPLFTACYSRYQEAAPTAPYVITLDEAFAGVDENNINEMFEIVEQLGFNYIMNSQILWGDYEAVKSLAVCQLVRPKNANYVTVIRYTWNGKELVPLWEEDEEQEQKQEQEQLEQLEQLTVEKKETSLAKLEKNKQSMKESKVEQVGGKAERRFEEETERSGVLF